MKADAPAAPPEPEVPSWVPEPIAQSARAKYAADVQAAYAAAIRETGDAEGDEEADALAVQDEVRDAYADFVREDLADIAEQYRPLVCDRRMRGVWRELSRQRNGAFLYPARAPSLTNAKERQGAAMLELFNTALECQNSREAIMSRGKAEQQRSRYLAKAEELQRDARTMSRQTLLFWGKSILTDKRRHALWRKLEDAADAYKEYASAIHTAARSMPKRAHDGRARWVAQTIGDKFRALFESPMYGLTAMITSVVLGRRIEPRTVRQWCAPHPAVKRQKNAP
jgi:hypothetical protein